MMKRSFPFMALLGLSFLTACTSVLDFNKKEEPVHPVVGKWAEAGKCDSMPWIFGPKSVRWGNNGGHWVDMGSKIKVVSYIAQEQATMTLYFTRPQNNVMRTLSLNYGGTSMSNRGGKLTRCSN
ncbi:MAG: hypothetical protein ACK5MJ_06860 [Alphaproteobacteria bacterium]